MTTKAGADTSVTLGPPQPTPTHGPGGSFSVVCRAHIAATPRACLDAVLNAPEYPTWNRFCRKCTITAQPKDDPACTDGSSSSSPDPDRLRLGTHFTFDVHMDPAEPDGSSRSWGGQTAALEVSVLEPIADDDGDESASPSSSPPTTRRTGWRVAWKTRTSLLMPGWMLHSERVQEFVEVPAAASSGSGGPETEYYCWETFYGVLAPVVRLLVGRQLERGFETWVEGLKKKVEVV
ncbi:hypothetical protein VTK56DRAFT_5521 [Thermocarpiscus australiensis]